MQERTLVAACIAAVAARDRPHAAAAQDARDYGSRPIRLVVPVPPGGSTDIVARIIAAGLQESAGLRMVIDNRGGAGGVIGSETVARAAPDGNTLLFAYAAFTTTPFISKVPYDPYRDFTPVTLLAVNPLLVVTNPSLPVANVKELIALAKSKPKGLNASIASAGSAGHLATGIVQGPYRHHRRHRAGDLQGWRGPAVLALVTGEVQVMFASVPTSLGHIKAGKAKVLATVGSKRLAAFPDSPTLTELGIKGVDAAAPWQAILGPAKMPRPIVMRLYSESAKVLKRPDIIERLAANGAEPVGSTPEELGERIKNDLQEFGKIIPTLGMKGTQ